MQKMSKKTTKFVILVRATVTKLFTNLPDTTAPDIHGSSKIDHAVFFFSAQITPPILAQKTLKNK